jgi:DNA-binding CsgD family transcriptional regulator
MRSIQVVVLSPIPALRAGLSALLSGDPEISVAGAADRLEDLPGEAPPGCVAVVAQPGGLILALGGAELPADLSALLVSDTLPGPGEQKRWAELGLRAWGVLSPRASAEALQAAVRALAEGLVTLSPELAEDFLAEAEAGGSKGAAPELDADAIAPADRLTGREVEVLRGLAQGLTNKAVALALGISEHTVKFHVSSIYAKLGAANRTEAVRKGARLGWIPL